MKKQYLLHLNVFFIFIASFFALPVYGQQSLDDRIKWREGSDSIFVFEITNKEALKFLKEGGSEKLMQKLLYKHVATFKGRWEDAPQQGHFIYATITKNKINYSYMPIIPFQVFLFREYGILTLQVIDADGEVRSDAKVKIQNGKWRLFDSQISYDESSKVYRTDDWSENPMRILTVEHNKFTAVFDLTKNIVRPSYGSDYGRRDRDSAPDFYSYMITDKNKYKPGEKVRFKSYALTGSKKPIKKELELWMEKPDRRYDFRKISTIDPYNPGGFADELDLHDSLKLRLDRNYSLQLRDKKGKVVARTSFQYEDYELYDNKIVTKLKDFTHYFPNDNEIEIKVVDANNLIMPDMKARVTVFRGDVRNSYVDLLVVPDIIRSDTIELNNDTPSIYKIPASLFDKTDCTYRVDIAVLTPDGQSLTASHNVVFYKSYYDINYQTCDSTIIFNYRELGIEKNTPAKLSVDGKEARDIVLPHTEVFKQNVESYFITIPELKVTKNINVSNIHHELEIKGGLVKDSLVLELINPLGLDVSWYVYEGNTLLEKGAGSDIDFKKPYIDLDVAYFLEIFFTMGGEDQVYRRVFAPKKEFLNIDWNMPDRIYPGQTIDSKIKVTDSRGNNVKGVDITAFAYNSLLNYYVSDLPYYGNTPRGREKRDSYYIEEKNINYSQLLTQKNYDHWNAIAHLDLYDYYRFIFPDPRLHEGLTTSASYATGDIPYHDIFKYTVDTPDGTTEFAPYVMLDGYTVDIYAIELDAKPVYFNWTGQPKGYSFLADSKSYHKISLRLHDRIIIIDNYCFDHGKKTIISVNLNNMPESSHVRTVKMAPKNRGTKQKPDWRYELENSEKNLYSKYISLIPVVDDRFTYLNGHVGLDSVIIPVFHPRFQKGRRYSSEPIYQAVGPLEEGLYRYMDGVEYFHEGAFKYKYAKNVVYKYPDNPCPVSLTQNVSNDLDDLNDFHYTPKEFGRKIGLVPVKEDKWFPGIVHLHNTKIHIPKDKEESGLRGVIMRNRETGKLFVPVYNRNVLGSYSIKDLYGLKDMTTGHYDVFALYSNGNYLRYDDVPLLPATYTELRMDGCQEHLKDSVSAKWLQYQPPVQAVSSGSNKESVRTRSYSNIGRQYFNPANDVRGVILDEQGDPLIGATISLKNTQAGTITDINGEFILDLHGAENTLVFSYIGFRTEEMKATRGSSITIVLKEDAQMLEEVVTVAFGFSKRMSMTGSVSSVLSGKAAGLITSNENEAESYTESEVVEDDASARLYNELIQLDGMRSNFSDVGFWEPKLVTDKKGETDFTVTFPDNITKWQSVVYAMNRKLKTGTLRRDINSYKPLMAEIKTPQFLVEGDSTLFSTNIRNYTKDKEIDGEIIFVNNGDSIFRSPIHFESSYQKHLPVVAPTGQDSLTFSYRFTRNDGYSDGEQRGISIEKQGVEIAEGVLQFLRNGDILSVVAAPEEQVDISITGKQIDIYMDAAGYLMGYKYACNEQLASKLIGLLNYRLYAQFKGEKFKYDKNVNEIVGRLLKNQNQNKLWSWWANDSNTSYWMSAHILRALNMARKAGYRVDLDISKVQYDYLDIHRFRNTSLYDIDVLNALVDWGTDQNYREIIELFEDKIAKTEIHEDSLVQRYKKTKHPKDYFVRNSYLTQKLVLTEMRQKLGLEYNRKMITDHINKDVFGAVNIKDTLRPRYWYYDNDAANITAYRIVRNDSTLQHYADGMQMYILGTKRYGWNTYQASSALLTILPDLLAESTTADNQATVTLIGKENRQIKEFPYNVTLHKGEQLSIRKESGMPLIYSAYTMKRRTMQHFGEAFEITTSIDRSILEKGVPVTMEVKVKVKQDNAEHVIIEVPVPAGCSYKSKSRGYGYYEVYREYFKEKVAIFCEKLPKGEYRYTIDLIPRYSGQYILNPAKVEMMYFPVINANNDMDKVDIK